MTLRNRFAVVLAAAMLSLSAALLSAGPTTQPATPPAYPLTTDVVTGELLGDHPIIDKVDGREVHFANAYTEAKFKAGGEDMQKKMDDAIIATTKDKYPLKTCPVSGEDISNGGDMGDVVMYVHRPTNQLVEFCCSSCEKKFKKAPDEYLAKIDAASKDTSKSK